MSGPGLECGSWEILRTKQRLSWDLENDLLIKQRDKEFLEKPTNHAKALWWVVTEYPSLTPEAYRNGGIAQDKAVEARQDLRAPPEGFSLYIII